jgi:hypothetical protein
MGSECWNPWCRESGSRGGVGVGNDWGIGGPGNQVGGKGAASQALVSYAVDHSAHNKGLSQLRI